MKSKMTIIIVSIIFIIVFLGYFLFKNTNLNSCISNKPKEIYVYIHPDLEGKYLSIFNNLSKSSENQFITTKNKLEAKIIIDYQKSENLQTKELKKEYINEYNQKENYLFEKKFKQIYFNYEKGYDFSDKFITESKNWNLFAAGDIMLSRHVGVKMRNADNWQMPLESLGTEIQKYDLSFANLESPFNEGGQIYDTGMTFGADPKTVKTLTYAGFDVISLANNHFGNMQNQGMTYTMNWLSQNKIKYAGAGATSKTSCNPTILDVQGFKIAFLAVDGVDSTPVVYRADSKYPGLCSWSQTKLIDTGIEIARKKADFVIVSMHAGSEYQAYHRQDQEDFAKKMIEQGANLVLGHHPHVAQDLETYKNGLIFYSLGNFIFDQMWSEETKQGLTLDLKFDNNQIQSFQIKPIIINNNYQPQFASQKISDQILSRIKINVQ